MLGRPRTNAKPVLPVRDMDEAVAWYGALGFDVEAWDASYAWARHKGEEILHLRLVEGLDVAANRSGAYVHVRDAEVWHFVATGGLGAAVGPLDDRPWGMREFEVCDPSGNVVRIGQNLR